MLLAALPVLWLLRKDFAKGLALASALIVSLPDYLRVSFGGSLPECTVQRVLLLIVLVFWLGRQRQAPLKLTAPALPWLCLFGAVQFVSMLLSIAKGGSFKNLFSYWLEVILFYVVVSTSLIDRRSILVLLRYTIAGLSVVAVLSAVEKYRDINISQWLVLGVNDMDAQNVTSTYPHRILFGYAMAMGVPIMLVLIGAKDASFAPGRIWLALLLGMAACYFSNSRGPWIGLIGASIAVVALGSAVTRRKLLKVAVLASLVLMVKPGVRETIVDSAKSLFETDSVKGNSAAYRKRLWYVAYAEISKSIERTAFGYGGLSTENMDLGHYFEGKVGGSASFLGYTSWDNQYACDLIEFGLVGFAAEVLLYLAVLTFLVRSWSRTWGFDRYLIGAIISCCVVYLWALSNVWIFSPQLKALFWMLVATGTSVARVSIIESALQGETQTSSGLGTGTLDGIPAFGHAGIRLQ
jgi:hypothetical protein